MAERMPTGSGATDLPPNSTLLRLTASLGAIGDRPEDSDKERLQHRFLVFMGVLMSGGGLVWGSLCLAFDLVLQSAIPFS
jgi:hypothetical protein